MVAGAGSLEAAVKVWEEEGDDEGGSGVALEAQVEIVLRAPYSARSTESSWDRHAMLAMRVASTS